MSEKVKSKLIGYLPSIYQDQENSFLVVFLRAFEKIIYDGWDSGSGNGNDVPGFDSILKEIDRYFIPVAPVSRNAELPPHQTDAEFLPWLAKWLDLTLYEEWGEKEQEQKLRENIRSAMDLYRMRGTVPGLKKYLQIYAGQEPEIRECCWPAGMQIGVASMIGGMTPEMEKFAKIEKVPLEPNDFYVVRENSPGGKVYYYRADKVLQVDVVDLDAGSRSVTIDYISPDSGAVERQVHVNVSLTRRDGLADTEYKITGEGEITAIYSGDTVLIDEEKDIPYRFIVDVTVPPEKLKDVNIGKIKAIVELEKPAHTLYYLRLIPKRVVTSMQIAVHSTIAVDTTIG
jgi:phage tail-like protein